MGDCTSSLDYITSCSQSALESTELARLDRASRLRKELRDVVEEWIEAEVEARVARIFLDMRRGKMPPPAPLSSGPAADAFEESLRAAAANLGASHASNGPALPPRRGSSSRARRARKPVARHRWPPRRPARRWHRPGQRSCPPTQRRPRSWPRQRPAIARSPGREARPKSYRRGCRCARKARRRAKWSASPRQRNAGPLRKPR